MPKTPETSEVSSDEILNGGQALTTPPSGSEVPGGTPTIANN
jgi:hypothetical protein